MISFVFSVCCTIAAKSHQSDSKRNENSRIFNFFRLHHSSTVHAQRACKAPGTFDTVSACCCCFFSVVYTIVESKTHCHHRKFLAPKRGVGFACGTFASNYFFFAHLLRITRHFSKFLSTFCNYQWNVIELSSLTDAFIVIFSGFCCC